MAIKSKRKCRPRAAYKPGPEKQIQNAIQDLLLAHRILHFRMNTGFLQSKAGSWVRFGCPGMADLLAFPQVHAFRDPAEPELPVPLWVEVKQPKGSQTPDQVSFQKIVEAENHSYIVAKSVDDVIVWLRKAGVIK